MHVRAFSAAKDPDRPETNEDRLVVVPDRLYAVIDGVTDRTSRRYGDRTGGRVAAETVELALLELAHDDACRSIDAAGLVRRLGQAFQSAYRAHGVLEEARAAETSRFGSTLALAVDRGDRFGFFFIGDSGMRLNGREVVDNDKDLDHVTATLRGFAYRRVAAAGADPTMTELASRALCWRGTRTLPPEARPWLEEPDLAAIRDAALAKLKADLPKIPVEDMTRLILDGIIGAQGGYQNRPDLALGYSSLDGFTLTAAGVRVFERPKAEAATLELFTDGYFALPGAATVAAWEAKADEVERVDPAKVAEYPSTKGSLGRIRADDRTVVIVSQGGAA
ncbi:MAG: hypothetical protein EXQ95_05830 [Alphaproteobacteria bacterium]|nr:hypothetical protein [Alphaproteobacteria bacterium]